MQAPEQVQAWSDEDETESLRNRGEPFGQGLQ